MKKEAFEDSQLFKIRHSCEHVFAQAVTELFPGKVKLAVAHISEDGWSNDARWDIKLSDEDLPKIEAKMKEIIAADLPIVKKIVSYEEAKAIFKDNPFKLEWLEEIAAADKEVSLYYTGESYADLCKGPHVESTGEIGAFKLLSVGGAYWRGSEENEMLTRVYGTAFASQQELDDYLKRMEEAQLRDHRKVGKDLDLFVFSDVVGKGLPLWTPKGSTIRRELERYIVDEELRRGYLHVYTPDIAKLELYQKSGHYPYYKDSMYAPIEIDDERFMLRPMTCPHHFEYYLSKPRSYKELPMRIAELAKLYRYEKSGELSGLMRVRSFCLADAHIVCTKEQAQEMINEVLELIKAVAETFGLKEGEHYSYRLSLGDRSDDKKYFKDDESWEYGESVLRRVLEARKAPFYEAEGEAAFYGPKIDIQMKNVLGKEDTAFTVQYDFVMPKRFKLNYINEESKEEEAIVIHRSSIGAIERVMAFLIEHFAGAFPVWLHPEQVRIIPIGLDQQEYAKSVVDSLKASLPGIRVSVDDSSNTLNKRILEAQQEKVPYMIVIGKQEVANGTVNVRLRNGQSLGEISVNDLAERVKEKIQSKALDL
ncbi:MAG: threonine--tRNA ligase [Candidatus Dojkabacteria bacterium]|nr:MAG: threonine--tRNA ligase [Candidatus Dojkabacteria bacterium]